jgi:XTP/dITP diphosphohydrolase
MPTIVLATGNPHKVGELRAILSGPSCRVMGLNDLPDGGKGLREPEETGTTFEENARIKALSYATQIGSTGLPPGGGYWCLADDSGIEIDALRLADGTPRPGVISSHYSSDGRETGIGRAERDAANNARVLRELVHTSTEQRTARFVCCMCLARAERYGESWKHAIVHQTRGTMEGRIGIPPRVPSGDNGFGYDPLFLVASSPFNYMKTGAELTSVEKNALSHRGAAGRAMAEWIAAQPRRGTRE